MRKVTFFIPHYEDHDRLIFMISMLDKVSEFPCKYVIYDSSPEPIGGKKLFQLDLKAALIYKEFKYNTKGHTYPYVLRDFCLSDDSDDGAFILPNDEMIILDYEKFSLVDIKSPFACGTQFSFCPTTRSVAEYSRANQSGHHISRAHAQGLYLPQYHGTYMPRTMLKGLGIYIKNFMAKWGDTNTTYIDFVIINILEQLDTFYSKKSIYIQEKMIKRKSNGMFLHPSQFIGNQNLPSIQEIGADLLKLWNSIENLSSKYFADSLNYLLNPKLLKNSLYMTNLNKSDFLFKLSKDTNPKLSIERIDIFSGYHVLGSSLSSKEINYLFNSSTRLGYANTLSCLTKILDSYDLSNLDNK